VSGLPPSATCYVRVGTLNWDGVANYLAVGSTQTHGGVAITSVSPSSGPVGELITVSGYGFNSTSSATAHMDSLGLDISSRTDTGIEITLPYLTTGQYQLVFEQRDSSGTLVESTSAPITVFAPSISSAVVSTYTYSFELYGEWFGSSVSYNSEYTHVLVDLSSCALSSWDGGYITGNLPDDTAIGTHTITVVREAVGGTQESNEFEFYLDHLNSRGLSMRAARAVSFVNASPNARLMVRADYGGYMESVNRTAIAIPKQALKTDSFVSIGLVEPDEKTAERMLKSESEICASPLGNALAFSAKNALLSDKAEITIPYDSAKIPLGKTAADLAVFGWDESSESWLELVSILYGNKLKAAIDKFGIYQILVKGVSPTATAAFGLKQFYVYPNPAKNGNKPILHLECGIGDSVDIRIYDIAGELRHSARMDGAPNVSAPEYAYEYSWDMSGAGSGVYVAVVEAHKAGYGNIKVKKTFAVVR